MDSPPKTPWLTTTQKVCLAIFPLLIALLVIMDLFNLDPDMVTLNPEPGIRSGYIKSIVGGMTIQPGSGEKPFKAAPLLPLPYDRNPSLGFGFLAEAHESNQPVCYRLAASEKIDDPAFIYDIHNCKETNNPSMPVGKSAYVSSVLSAGIVTLAGYEDGIEGAGGGKSTRVDKRFILLSDGNSTMRFIRSTQFGFPNGTYKPSDIGKRFCASIHTIYTVKFDKEMRPIGYWGRSKNGVYLWSCDIANRSTETSFVKMFH